MDPRGGADFDENGPNLTEDVFWALETTLVGSVGPEGVQSSGIESNTGERSDIISSWHRAVVEHALTKASNGNTDRGPMLKVRDNVDQLIVGLVLCSHGRPKTIRADGWSFVTRRERFCIEPSVKATEVVTDSWINPTVAGLPLKRHRVMGRSKGSITN